VPGVGALGVGAGVRFEVGAGEGFRVSAGVGLEVGAKDGLGVGAGIGPGVGLEVGAGVGAAGVSISVGAGEGASLGAGVGSGVGTGVDFRVGFGVGAGVIVLESFIHQFFLSLFHKKCMRKELVWHFNRNCLAFKFEGRRVKPFPPRPQLELDPRVDPSIPIAEE
jgi:hypothetical protein